MDSLSGKTHNSAVSAVAAMTSPDFPAEGGAISAGGGEGVPVGRGGSVEPP